MYQQLLKEHIDDKKAYGEQPQPPATKAQLQALRARAKKELGVDLPAEYYRLLETTNGLDSNGVVIYASEAGPLVGYPDRPLDGLVEANLTWWELPAHKRYLFFGDAGMSLYAYDLEDHAYKVLDRQSNTVLEEFKTFEELIHRALEENHP
jgi:SMI1/KNR4 family protein SUKH-1